MTFVAVLLLLLLFEGVYLAGTQTVVCPDAIAVIAQDGKPYADVDWIEPSIDQPQILTYKSHSPGRFPLGTTLVTYEYSEYSASLMEVLFAGSCSFTIDVMAVDSVPPLVIDCPSSPQRRPLEAGTKALVVTWTEPSATDNSGQVDLVENSARSGDELYLGFATRKTVSYTFEDPSGNRAYCFFEIEFIAVDTTPPNIRRCSEPLIQEVPLDANGAVVPLTFPTVSDNSGQFTLTVDPMVPDNFFSLGTHQITFNITDPSGNYATCVTSVQVLARDLTPPEITYCPSSFVIGAPPGVGTADVDWFEPEAIDNSGTVLLDYQTEFPGIYSVDTALEVAYVFQDLSGNEAACLFSVRVIEDAEPPTVFGCPAEGIERFIEPVQTETQVFYPEPFSLDETWTNILYQSHESGDVFLVGNTAVEYVFEDWAGNTANCTFNLRVTVYEEDDPIKADTNTMEVLPRNTTVVVIVVCVFVLVVTLLLVIGFTVCWLLKVKTSAKPGSFAAAPPQPVYNEGFYSELGGQERQLPSNSALQPQRPNVEYIEMEPAEEANSYVKPS